MATTLPLLTKNDVAGTSVSDVHFDQPGKQSARAAINAALGAANGLITGTATILNTTDTITVLAATLGGTFGGSPVQLTINEAAEDTTLFRLRYVWSGDDLVITGNANATADVDVTFSVDTRA